jgi:hypothetical protein
VFEVKADEQQIEQAHPKEDKGNTLNLQGILVGVMMFPMMALV